MGRNEPLTEKIYWKQLISVSSLFCRCRRNGPGRFFKRVVVVRLGQGRNDRHDPRRPFCKCHREIRSSVDDIKSVAKRGPGRQSATGRLVVVPPGVHIIRECSAGNLMTTTGAIPLTNFFLPLPQSGRPRPSARLCLIQRRALLITAASSFSAITIKRPLINIRGWIITAGI